MSFAIVGGAGGKGGNGASINGPVAVTPGESIRVTLAVLAIQQGQLVLATTEMVVPGTAMEEAVVEHLPFTLMEACLPSLEQAEAEVPLLVVPIKSPRIHSPTQPQARVTLPLLELLATSRTLQVVSSRPQAEVAQAMPRVLALAVQFLAIKTRMFLVTLVAGLTVERV